MYLKIRFIFYLTSGIEIEEFLTYQKAHQNIPDEDFEKDVKEIETNYRKQLEEFLIYKPNKAISIGDTIFNSSNLIAFKTMIEKVEDNVSQFNLGNGFGFTPVIENVEEAEIEESSATEEEN